MDRQPRQNPSHRHIASFWTPIAKKRIENLRISLFVRSGEKEFRLRHDFQFRMYTAGQFCELLNSVRQFELVDVYDFWYDISEPLVLDDIITDTVFILRKK